MKAFIPLLETNSKFILKAYDKNLLQNNGYSENCEIPIDGYLGVRRITINKDINCRKDAASHRFGLLCNPNLLI